MLFKLIRATPLPFLVAGVLLAAQLFAIAILLPARAQAHEAPPSIIDAGFRSDGSLILRVTVPLSAAHDDAATTPVDDAQSPVAKLQETADAIRSTMTVAADGSPLRLTMQSAEISEDQKHIVGFSADLPPGVAQLAISPGRVLGDSLIRLERAGAPAAPKFASAGTQATFQISAPISAASAGDVFADYLWSGFVHIVPMGLDHILFVVGLFLLTLRLRPLLMQVSLFTLAHSVTLVLGASGLIFVPAGIVEPLIAVSIVFIAVENMVAKDLSRWRPFVVFAFGLLHGLGFASVMAEFGLPQDHFVVGLIAFNLGVEMGQLFVLGLCFASVGLWFSHKSWYRRRVSVPASVLVAATGAFWTIERVGGVL